MKKFIISFILVLPFFSFAGYNYYFTQVFKDGKVNEIVFSGSQNISQQNMELIKKLLKENMIKNGKFVFTGNMKNFTGQNAKIIDSYVKNIKTEKLENINTVKSQNIKNIKEKVLSGNSSKEVKQGSGDMKNIDTIRIKMLDLINKERKVKGLSPLVLNSQLNNSAQKYAEYMSKNNDFAHVSKNGSTPASRAAEEGYKYRSLGENIAMGQKTVEKVINSWMNSQGHRENILGDKYTQVGIGFYNNYWVQDFGLPSK